MEPKEIFKTALRLEPTKRVPVMVLAGGVWELKEHNLSFQEFLDLDSSRMADYIIRENEKIKLGEKKMLGVSQWGPMTLASLLLGASEFMIQMMLDKEAVQYMMEFTRELVLTYWNLFLEAGVDLVCQAEPVASGDMISKEMFEEFALPHLIFTNRRIKEKGCARMLHICGKTEPILPLIPKTETDLFSVDWQTSLKKARKELGGKTAFAGQIDPTGILLLGDAKQVTEVSKRCMEDAAWQEGGYFLMSGCDLAPGTSIENIHAMVETAYASHL